MRTSKTLTAIAVGATLFLGACATVPPGPPPDVVRLQNDLDRLHGDPRIADNAGPELANADAAVDVLARNARMLDARAYTQGVYIADKLVGIAEASALARFAEQRGAELGIERERLMARTTIIEPRRTTTIVSGAPPPTRVVREDVVRTDTGELVPASRAELITMQQRMPGVESRLDSRGLVVRLGDFMFEPNRAELTPTAERQLDSVAAVLSADADAGISVEAYGGDGLAPMRAAAVRDYLDARGVDGARVAIRSVDTYATRGQLADNDRRVDIVIRGDYR
jgi:outer membrane protein OmpA-like peptidoglycan-associated protein